MQIHLTGYAKSHILRDGNKSTAKTSEYLDCESKISEGKEEYAGIIAPFQKEAERLNLEEKNPLTKRSKLVDIQNRATEAVKAIAEKIDTLKKELSEINENVLKRIIIEKTKNEVDEIRRILDQHGINEIQEGELTTHTRFGKGLIVNLDFKIEKNVFKELKSELKNLKSNNVEIIFTEIN